MTEQATRDPIRDALSLFASVIKCGEPWTDTCQQALDTAAEALYQRRAALEAAEVALAAMRASHGMHGPCRHNDCADCQAAYNKASSALATVRAAMGRARGEGGA